MSDHLRVYKAKLHVLCPTFVGSGKDISKKEYRLSPTEQKVVVYDPGKFYQVVQKHGKSSQYEDFLLNDKNSDLNYWIKKNGLSVEILSPAIRYSVAWGDRMELGNSKVQIMEFMKDPYGKPYVPGTSIKGMLRTILLGYEISQRRRDYDSVSRSISGFSTDRPSNKAYTREAKEVETTAFNTLSKDEKSKGNAVNDVMQGLIISDSKPLNTSDLVLCQKIDYHPDKEKKPLNILRECLRPGVDIEFTITIDKTACKYDDEIIFEAIKVFNKMYHECFLSKFGSGERPANTVYLGGGVGFVSKTIIYPLYGSDKGVKVTQSVFRNTLHPRIFTEHGHGKDLAQGVSPHIMKCTKLNGKNCQMGMCRFEMQEA